MNNWSHCINCITYIIHITREMYINCVWKLKINVINTINLQSAKYTKKRWQFKNYYYFTMLKIWRCLRCWKCFLTQLGDFLWFLQVFFLLNSANYAIFAIFQLLNVFFSAVSTVATVREKTQANGIKSAKLKQTSRELSKCQFSLKF